MSASKTVRQIPMPMDDKYHKQALKNVRFARVIVSEVPNE